MSRIRLAVLFGGMSSEHEISLRSARCVLDAVDPDRFCVTAVGIGRDGVWRSGTPSEDLAGILARGALVTDLRALAPDVVFPVLHGPNGEDGAMAGLLELYGLAYVGSGVLAAATCMDKAVQKHLIARLEPGLPLLPWVELDARSLHRPEGLRAAVAKVEASVSYPCFSKPANLGSSIGVSRCEDSRSLGAALAQAASLDTKLVVEKGVDAREIELAVLGNGGPETVVSEPGEIVLPRGTWYDYRTKYDSDVASYQIPADLGEAQRIELQRAALRAFSAMGCSGLARVDFLLDRASGTPYLNELNTMPGFTSISMYPKLCEHAGVGYQALISRLCDLALDRHRTRSTLRV